MKNLKSDFSVVIKFYYNKYNKIHINISEKIFFHQRILGIGKIIIIFNDKLI